MRVSCASAGCSLCLVCCHWLLDNSVAPVTVAQVARKARQRSAKGMVAVSAARSLAATDRHAKTPAPCVAALRTVAARCVRVYQSSQLGYDIWWLSSAAHFVALAATCCCTSAAAMRAARGPRRAQHNCVNDTAVVSAALAMVSTPMQKNQCKNAVG